MSAGARKKILFVITKANWGGAQRYVFDLATGIRDEFDTVVAFGQEGLLAEKLREAGVSTFPIRALQRDISFASDVKSFFELIRFFRKEHPDIVHLNSSKAAGLGALAARIARVPQIIFTAHGWPFKEHRGIAWLAFAFFGSWATALLSHDVIVVSKDDLRIGKRLPFCAHKMHLIYNGIELPPLGSGENIRDAFPKGARITGTIGELTKNKNQIELIEQAKNNPRMFVAIVGEGEDRAYLTKKIADYGLRDRVKLFGFMPAADVLRGFDTFALPSLKEGLPYVLIEARMAGLPIVANRVGGVGEILDAKDMRDFSLEAMVKNTIAVYR
ncbi:MAG: glycosyltransferase [Minisyncoccia bacterium]